MSDFGLAINFILQHEGGFVHHPDDPGGATKYGISLRYVLQNPELRDHFDADGDGDVDPDDIRAMTRAQAEACYRRQWWDRYGYARIKSDAVAMRVFSFAINMGPIMAHRIAQRTCRAAGRYIIQRDGRMVHVAEDGQLGPISIAAINGANEYAYLCALRSEAAGHYRLLVERNRKFQTFINGWLNRAYS